MHMTVTRLAEAAGYALDLFSKEGDLPAVPLYGFRPLQAYEKRIVPYPAQRFRLRERPVTKGCVEGKSSHAQVLCSGPY